MDWHFLTGTSEEDLKPLLAGFGQVVERGADLGRINHTLRLFLVDADGRIRNIYGLGTMDPRLLMSDIATLLLEQAGAR
jgi:protein SCO1/2